MTDFALFSPDGLHRYRLDRTLPTPPLQADEPQAHGAPVVFIMLNPSTADATNDDPTIRRCKTFARRFGAGALRVVNLYSYRTTWPAELYGALQAGIPLNTPRTDEHIVAALAASAPFVITAWGNRPPKLDGATHDARIAAVLELIDRCGRRPYALGTTKTGYPRHPVRLANDTHLAPWSPR